MIPQGQATGHSVLSSWRRGACLSLVQMVVNAPTADAHLNLAFWQ